MPNLGGGYLKRIRRFGERCEQIFYLAPQPTLVQVTPISCDRDRKAWWYLDSFRAQLPEHFSEGGVLATNGGHVFIGDLIET